MRTLLSAVAVGVQVTMILTLVGVSQGMLNDIAVRSRGTGADILVRPPDSSVFTFSGIVMPEKVVDVVRQVPHITLATEKHSFGGHLESGTTVFTFAIVTLGVLADGVDLRRMDDKTNR